MKEYPMLFNGDMVRAILEGRKTMTRRLMKPQPEMSTVCISWKGGNWSPYPHKIITWDCSFGVPGDRLWVKETHAIAKDAIGKLLDTHLRLYGIHSIPAHGTGMTGYGWLSLNE